MKKLYFLAHDREPLAQLRAVLSSPVASLGRYTLLSEHAENQRHPRLAATGIMTRSDIVGLSWRAGLWSVFFVLLCLAVLLPLLGSSPMRAPVLYGLPVFGVAFGAWLGGLLGLMRINPEYQAWQDQLELGARLVAVAVPPECERMLRRQMADCGWQYLSQTLRYAGSYRFPQNRLEVGAI